MGIEPKFSIDDIKARIWDFTNTMDGKILKTLQYVGEQCINHAREAGNYTDRTGNLRNSIGYCIFKDGKLMSESFSGGDNEGTVNAQLTASAVAHRNAFGWVLVVVAGMNYALYVESKNYNVLSSAEHLAESIVPGLLSQLK